MCAFRLFALIMRLQNHVWQAHDHHMRMRDDIVCMRSRAVQLRSVRSHLHEPAVQRHGPALHWRSAERQPPLALVQVHKMLLQLPARGRQLRS
jgi:hypothetical protein